MSEKLVKRQVSVSDKLPYHAASVQVDVFNEYNLSGDVIKPGDKIRIKQTRGEFTFRMVAHNTVTDSMWVDCYESKTGFFRSFPVEMIKCVVRPKKKRVRKTKVAYIGK
jgi:hypothetical protein